MRTLAVWLAAALVLAGPARAHDVSRSDSKIEIDGREARVTLTLNPRELRNPAIPFERQDSIFNAIRQHYFLRGPDFPANTRLEKATVLGGQLLQFQILYLFTHDLTSLNVKSTLHEIMPDGHQHLMSVRLNGTLQEAILDSHSNQASFTGVGTTKLATIWRFARLGIEHIFTGYDHLAFLLGLLVAASTVGALVRIVTSFTVAHSITLALATFNVVVLPTRLTESLIALSIGYVAAENLLGFRAMKRYYITFLFGLVHGFGFSNVLREMDLPKASLALSLFSFNAGVEIGQIAFVLLLFPLLQDLISSGWKQLRPAVSIGVACLAVYWFVQRAFLA